LRDRGYSEWDRIPLESDNAAGDPLSSRSDARVARSRRRTLITNDDAAFMDELLRRRQSWYTALSFRLGRTESTRSEPRPSQAGVDYISGLIVATLISAFLVAPPVELVAVASIPLALLCVVAVRRQLQRALFRRLLGALLEGRCARCGYRSDIPPEMVRVCPECGDPWPLLPPEAIPAVLRTRGYP
jgi:hypothetical protein